MIRTCITLLALAGCAATLTVSAPVFASGSRTGTIEVIVTDPVKQPIRGWEICPTIKRFGKTKAGRCATTNVKGLAKLTHVKAGTVYISYFSGGLPAVGDPQKITVKAGRTSRVRWENAGS